MYLPVAGISINLFLVVTVGGLIGFLSGLVGVGGGFLLTPILMMIGVPPTIAAASGACALVGTSSSGTSVHFRLGNVDLRLGGILLLGGLAGAAIGVHVIKLLRALGSADFVITATYVVMLSSIGAFMFVESLQSLRRGMMASKTSSPIQQSALLKRLPFQMNFPRSNVRHSVFVPFALCALVGILAAIMGVGGGFIMVPMMVYLLRMPMHVAVGTDLFQILFTCAGVTLMQAATNQTVDVVLALLVAIGSTVGAQVGARMVRLLRGEQLRIVLASIVLATSIKMTLGLLIKPASLLASVGGN
ncbi:MAG TPA: sulfite exporter TauE/SafE family protein [Terracidiphilus sp.]|nr:sulfite exporter TauE/SafE family protein [Terracidiphilus sp.]